jgi:hypothetical protein
MITFSLLQTGNPLLDRVQQNILRAFEALGETLNIARVVADKAIATGDTAVPHGLGRVPRGYIVVKRSAGEVVFDGAGAHPRPAEFINLRASAAVTVSLVFF